MGTDCVFVEGLNVQTKMIHIVAFTPGARSARTTQFSVDRDEVDQTASGPQLNQAHCRVEFAFDRQAEDILVKMQGTLRIVYPDHHVVQPPNG